jgi:hypothetical protein
MRMRDPSKVHIVRWVAKATVTAELVASCRSRPAGLARHQIRSRAKQLPRRIFAMEAHDAMRAPTEERGSRISQWLRAAFVGCFVVAVTGMGLFVLVTGIVLTAAHFLI